MTLNGGMLSNSLSLSSLIKLRHMAELYTFSLAVLEKR